MKTLGSSRIVGILLLSAFHLPLVVSFDKVTIPAELKSVTVRVLVNTTSCSVTCGLGIKLEETCEITPAGERRNCSTRRSDCLTNWFCGLVHFTVPVGKPFQLSCLASDAVRFGSRAYSYRWRLAQGLITTNDVLFEPFKNPDYIVRFSPTRESDAGTYRCDVQTLKTLKIVQRIYFGVRVIQNDLVDLNFRKSLTWEQKLAADEQEGKTANSTREAVQEQQRFWQGELFYMCLVGAGSVVVGVVLVNVALYSLKKIFRR
ncbi:TMM81 protein, partial [Bucorvus abyssinicus]|nr:TMM81 protein [Bucorvus abyssinicus]